MAANIRQRAISDDQGLYGVGGIKRVKQEEQDGA